MHIYTIKLLFCIPLDSSDSSPSPSQSPKSSKSPPTHPQSLLSSFEMMPLYVNTCSGKAKPTPPASPVESNQINDLDNTRDEVLSEEAEENMARQALLNDLL